MSVSKDISDFEQILDSCLARLQAGETMAQCLGNYRDREQELRPLLETAVAVQAAPLPVARPLAVEQGQAGMLAALAGRERNAAVSFGSFRRYAERIRSVLKQEEAFQMRLALRSIVTTVVVLFFSGFFALAISANSLPGEPFYPIKRGWESARLGLTFDADARQLLEAQIQQNRQDELAALIELGRQSRISYEGIVAQIEEGQLVVDDFPFLTNRETVWRIRPEVGEAVRVETEVTTDGQLRALEISAGSLDFRPSIVPTATPCNTPACVPPTATSTPCNAGACGGSTPTPVATKTPNGPTPTPCNSPACATPTPCNTGACNGPTPSPIPTNTPGNNPTPTPCNSPACAPPTATPTPCNAGACNGPTPTPIPTNTPGNNPTPTPCNSPACAPPTATPTPCNAGACNGPSPTPIPTNTPGNPTPTPCNSPACATSTPIATPTQCNTGACGGPTPTPPNSPPSSPTLCNTVGCD